MPADNLLKNLYQQHDRGPQAGISAWDRAVGQGAHGTMASISHGERGVTPCSRPVDLDPSPPVGAQVVFRSRSPNALSARWGGATGYAVVAVLGDGAPGRHPWRKQPVFQQLATLLSLSSALLATPAFSANTRPSLHKDLKAFSDTRLQAPVSGKLYAAAGKADITPDLAAETVWLAGYGASGRRAKAVHDPLYARALVVSDGAKTAALVSVDALGLFREDVQDIRRALGWDGKGKYLFLTATHTHSGPDTLGLWGRFPGVSGVDARYQARLKESVVRLVRDLSGRMQEAQVTVASRSVDPAGLCRDSRDPVVIDPGMDVLEFRSASRGSEVLATLVRWSCHAEVLGADNLSVTADYPGALCARLEAKGHGSCVFLNGLIGGLLTPDGDHPADVEQAFKQASLMGERLAELALQTLQRSPVRFSMGEVSFQSKTVRVPVENSRYLLFLRSLFFGHRLLDQAGRPLSWWERWWLPVRHLVLFPLPERLRPWVETEASFVKLGPVEFLGIPGEMFPELAIGGYDGKYRFSQALLTPGNPDPPDLSRAPRGPFLRAKIKSRHPILVGLANDELGYIVPDYDFKIKDNRFMLPRLPGHHYEETNSIGKSATRILLDAYEEMLSP